MTHLILTALGAGGLILLVAFVGSRLLRARAAGGLSIRMQIFLALASTIGAFALGLGVLVLDRIEARTTRIAEEAARDEAAALAVLVGGELAAKGSSLEGVARRLELVRGSGEDALHLALLDAEGKEVFVSGPSPGEPGTVFVTVPVESGGRHVGSVRVVKPTLVVRRVLEDFAPTILLISLALGTLTAGAAALIGRAIARPIEGLTEFAALVSEGERRALPPPAWGREVQRLSRAIDSMRRQLEGRPFVETFAADLSHELKNPVAAIRASAEVLADGALEEPEEAARFVARIREATTRIEALLGDLLSLARIEARGVEHAALVSLAELTEDAARRARERGASFRFALEAEPGDRLAVRGEPAWVARAIDNLLDNALVHGGGSAELLAYRAGGDVIVAVRNPGTLSPHVAKRLFRRFVTTRADRGGTGLGLAIVRAIAEAHGGAAECRRAGPPEVEFRIRLPAA